MRKPPTSLVLSFLSLSPIFCSHSGRLASRKKNGSGIGDAARGSESVFSNFHQCHSRNYSDSRFPPKRCVSDEISKASDLDVGDCCTVMTFSDSIIQPLEVTVLSYED